MNLDAWKELSRTAKTLITFVAATLGALVTVASAWPVVEPYVYAHRGYVRNTVERLRREIDPIRLGMNELQLSIARSRRSAVTDRIITLEIEAPKSNDQSELVQRRQQIEVLKEEKAELDEQIKAYMTIRGRN